MNLQHEQKGVTLIELMIVIVIVGILAAIAIPTYRAYVLRANRADAKALLARTSQQLERCYTNSTPYAYNSATCAAALVFPITDPAGNYRVIAPVLTAQTYTLNAVPAGAQTADTQCATFTLTQAGVQNVTGSFSATPAQCWRR